MTPNSTQPTAKIYQFPVGGRAALSSRSEPARPTLTTQPPAAAGTTKPLLKTPNGAANTDAPRRHDARVPDRPVTSDVK